MDPEAAARTQSLIDQLDEKITSLNATRVNPADVANQFATNIQGFVSQLVANFLLTRERQEQETRRPRDVIKQIIPIDIVSITPGAADQIVQALAAAGLGRYKLNIKQINRATKSSTEPTGGGMSIGAMTAVGAGVGFMLNTLADYLESITGWFSEKWNSIGDYFGFEDEETEREYRETTGERNMITDEVDRLRVMGDDMINNPQLALTGGVKPPDVPESENLDNIREDLKQQDLIPDIQPGENVTQQMVQEYTETRDFATDQFFQEQDGKNYVDELLYSQSRQSVDDVVVSVDKLNQSYEQLFSDTQPESRQSFLTQATSKQGMTLDWLQQNQGSLKQDITPQQAYDNLAEQYGENKNKESVQTQGALSAQQKILEKVVTRDDQDVPVADYVRSTDFLKQSLNDENLASLEKMQDSLYKIPEQPSNVDSDSIDDLVPVQGGQQTLPDVSSKSVQIEDMTQVSEDSPMLVDTQKIEQLLSKNLTAYATSIEQLTSIREALSNKLTSDTSTTNINKAQSTTDDGFNVEYIRSFS